MTPEERAQLREILPDRSEDLAEAWYRAVRAESYATYSPTEAQLRLVELAERAVDLLLTDSPDRAEAEAEAIGAAFAPLRPTPESLGQLQEALIHQLVQGLPANLVAALQPGLGVLMGGLATGLFRRARSRILAGQEQIRNAHVEALERARHQLRIKEAAIDSSIAGIALSDLEGTVSYANPAALAMWGYDDPQEVLGRPVVDFWASIDRMSEVLEVVRETRGWVGELVGKRKDGATFPILLSASLVRTKAGHPARIMGSFVDITRRKQAEEMVYRQVARLEALHRIDQAILAARSPQEIIEVSLQHIRKLVPCERAVITSCDFEAGELVIRAVHSDQGTSVGEGVHFPMAGFERYINKLRQGELIVIDDARTLPQSEKATQAIRAEGFNSFASVPIIIQGDLFGFLSMSWKRVGGPDCEHVPIARELADSIAIAMRQARLHAALEQQSEHLRLMMDKLAEAEEAERHRVAQVLHDRVGQNLTALGLNLNLIRSQIAEGVPDSVLARLDDALKLLEETTQRIRLVMTDLRPPMLDDYGLVPTLRWYADQFSSRTGLRVAVHGQNPPTRPPIRVERALFRIAQEALTNAAKHAHATGVAIHVSSRDETMCLVIRDDGVGFDPEENGAPTEEASWGLLTMSEQAEAVGGCCKIRSEPEEGTRVIVEVTR